MTMHAATVLAMALAGAFAAVLVPGTAQVPGAAVPHEGDLAPAFSLPGTDGKTHSLSEFKGKQAVVLAWFPKAFTGG
jgi:thioredoxin-dependent peroxiredoxin